MARKAIDAFHINGFGQVFQIAVCLRSLKDPVQRATGKAQGTPALARNFAQSLQSRRVGGESCNNHLALRGLDGFEQVVLHTAFATAMFKIEDVGGIAHHRQYARVPNRG